MMSRFAADWAELAQAASPRGVSGLINITSLQWIAALR